MKRFTWQMALITLIAPHAQHTRAQPPSKKVAKWAEQIISRPEFGEDFGCARWVATPTLSIFGGSAAEKRVIADTIKHLNVTLAKTPIHKIKLLTDNNPKAAMRVYFAPLQKLPALARKHEFEYVEGNRGMFWYYMNEKNEINEAYVLLASDQLSGSLLRHFALEEITQALGLANDSPTFADSIFHSGRGTAQKLSDLDKKLIIFFYNHISPGSRLPQIRKALQKHWK